MCGIFGLFNHEHVPCGHCKTTTSLTEIVARAFNTATHRGPDNSTLIADSVSHSFLGFHRLTINGSKHYYASNQPICKNDIVLLCNGEIYNYPTLLNELGLTAREKAQHSGSDCEIIIDLYIKFGMATTLELLDGVFAFILLDMRCLSNDNHLPKIFISRDPFGLRPLYWLKHNDAFLNGSFPELMGTCMPFGFASEMKQLVPILNTIRQNENDGDVMGECLEIVPFPPGHYCCYTGTMLNEHRGFLQKDTNTFDRKIAWFIQPSSINIKSYFAFPHFRQLENVGHIYNVKKIQDYLINAVDKRIHCTERPIACLLSGGIDSSLICGIIRKLLPDKVLETYSIGMKGASDKEHIDKVVEHIQSNHIHVELPKEDFLAAIPTVIRLLETHDITTIRASVGNYLIAKYIREHSDAKVIFNGDGSDELFGGYKYFLNCPDKYEFNRERKRLLTDIHYFDVLRSERSISVNGLEARTPFLDKELVSYVMTLNQDLTYTYTNRSFFDKNIEKMRKTTETTETTETMETMEQSTLTTDAHSCVFEAMKSTGIEKWMLRRAFIESDLIPRSILCRSKEAFSDGVSSEEDSWYIIIQKHLVRLIARNVRVEDDGKLVITSSVLLDDERDDDINVCELRENDLYKNILLCYNTIDTGITTLSDEEMRVVMLNIERWYYKKVYYHYYGSIVSSPYNWMPKYSNETRDPSARTLDIYNNPDNDTKNKSALEIENENYNKIMLNNIGKLCVK